MQGNGWNLIWLITLAGGRFALEECDSRLLDFKDLPESCQKVNGELEIFSGYEEKDIQLQEVTKDITLYTHFPASMKRPIKAFGLFLTGSSSFEDDSFTQITAEEVSIYARKEKVIFNMEPVKFSLTSDIVKNVTGITGTRLRDISVNTINQRITKFEKVESLDFLDLRKKAGFEIVPNLKTAQTIQVKDYQVPLVTAVEKVVNFTIKFHYSEEARVDLRSLTTVEDHLEVTGKLSSFSAPKLTYGRLVFQTESQTLDLNRDLDWKGEAIFHSADFCEKYFDAFVARALEFDTPNNCEAKCRLPPTNSINFKFLSSCVTIQTLNLNHQSLQKVHLDKVITIIGDLIIDSYNGSFSASSLTEITGNLIIKNYNSFYAPNLLKITGNLSIVNFSLFSAPELIQVQGNVAITNATSFDSPNLIEIGKSLVINDSFDCSLPKLEQIDGDLKISNSNFTSRRPFYLLERARKVHLSNQKSSLEFNSFLSIASLKISKSSLTAVTGIDVTHLDSLILEECPYLNQMPLANLKSIGDLTLSATGFLDFSRLFPESFDVTNNVTIKKFPHERLTMHLRTVGGYLTIEENNELQSVRLNTNPFKNAIISIRNPNLRVIKFNDIQLTHIPNASPPKALVASTLREKQNQVDSESNPSSETKTEAAKDKGLPSSDGKMDPGARAILKVYIMVGIPLALLATVGIFMYLK